MIRTKGIVLLFATLFFSVSIAMAMSNSKKDIVDTAIENGSFGCFGY